MDHRLIPELNQGEQEWLTIPGNTTEDVRRIGIAITAIFAENKELTILNIYRLARTVNYGKVQSFMRDVYGWEV